jgi:hypothetical protein
LLVKWGAKLDDMSDGMGLMLWWWCARRDGGGGGNRAGCREGLEPVFMLAPPDKVRLEDEVENCGGIGVTGRLLFVTDGVVEEGEDRIMLLVICLLPLPEIRGKL